MQSDMTAMKNQVRRMMNEYLPAGYLYHCYQHCEDVLEATKEIAKQEKINGNELRLLETAALWHDLGYIKTREGHEAKSCLIVREYLPHYKFKADEIKIICGMIMATKAPQSPTNILEKIIADADLAYLGSEKVRQKSERLFEELRSVDPSLTKKTWKKKQISFLKTHHYFTEYCRQEKEPLKKKYLDTLLIGDEKINSHNTSAKKYFSQKRAAEENACAGNQNP